MIIIEAELSAPPSEVTLFRDITLFSNSFLRQNVVLECEKFERDFYYHWLKDRGCWDYVEDFVNPNTELGLSIRTKRGKITAESINYNNYNLILNRIRLLYIKNEERF